MSPWGRHEWRVKGGPTEGSGKTGIFYQGIWKSLLVKEYMVSYLIINNRGSDQLNCTSEKQQELCSEVQVTKPLREGHDVFEAFTISRELRAQCC